jgi:GntR family transcriptional regulator / MocR family aminotransferase
MCGTGSPFPIRRERAMQLPLSVRPEAGESLQAQIYRQLRQLILDGRLRPGQRIPGTRTLAEALRVSRNTVLLACDRLISEGYLETRPGASTVVSPRLPDAPPEGFAPRAEVRGPSTNPVSRAKVALDVQRERLSASHHPPPAIDFIVGRVDPHSFPLRAWRRHLLRALDDPRAGPSLYPDPAGYRPLREAIAAHLGATRGISTNADRIVITEGIQEAFNLAARLLVRERTPVAIENPCYRGLVSVLRSCGARLLPVPVDESGIEVERLPSGPVGLVCVTPSHQFPTGYTMTLERRLRLLDWAAARGAFIVEDDYDSDFRYDGPPLAALAGLDTREQVIYLGTFSKSLGAGLRIGYLALPRSLATHIVSVKSLLDAGRAPLEQAALSGFLTDGGFERHLRRIRIGYRRRRDCLLQALRDTFDTVEVSGQAGGMHIMWHLPQDFPPATTVEAAALRRGVGVYALGSGVTHSLAPDHYRRHSLVLGYAALSDDAIREGIARLGTLRFDRKVP